jgi:uncharacterized Ntn-hydrolase superfamily protein
MMKRNDHRQGRNTLLVTAALLFASTHVVAAPTAVGGPLVHTFSIVARDAESGQIGVAVQSHWFSVGPIVPWAEPGVGAVATQSLVEVSYGPRGLALMRQGLSAPEALEQLLAGDPDREVRQVAMIDAQGRVAAHTGKLCIAEAGHVTGDQFSAQANLMLNDKVWGAMAEAYGSATGDLTGRLLAALDAAQAVGGDIRGQQSAAILVVDGIKSDSAWAHKVIDLRVEDHPLPLTELRRLVKLNHAYDLANQGDEFVAAQDFDRAMAAYGEATDLSPGNIELQFWKAASLYKVGQKEEALPLFREVFEAETNWALVVPRLAGLNILADDPEGFTLAVQEILAVAPPEAREAALEEWTRRLGHQE